MGEIRVATGIELQPALNRALPGDEIILPSRERFVGTFVLPPKAGRVTLCSGIRLGQRIDPLDAPMMATIASGSSGRAIDGTGAANWLIDSVRFEPNVGGFGEVLGFEGAENIELECILLVVPEGQQQKRGILGNGRHITLTRSHLSGIWRQGQDSQAFAAWDGAGPYTLTDNYLEAASENILFGGADASSEANIPADILIDGNTITKAARWKGDGVSQVVKNLFELKAARRVVVRRNLFEGNWGGEGQSGTAIVLTPVNQNMTAPWTVIEDVLFERNTIRDTDMGISVTGYGYHYADVTPPQGGPTRQTTRIVFRDNLIESRGRAFYFGGEIGTLQAYRNRLQCGEVVMSLDGDGKVWPEGQAERASTFAVADLTWAENVTPEGSYIHSATALNDAALKAYVKNPVVLTVPTDAPSVPDVIDGPPVPLPGTTIDAPSMPEPSALELDMRAVKAELADLIAAHAKLLAYLKAAPKVTRIEQLRAYIKAAPGV
jgi:hypothetical protein